MRLGQKAAAKDTELMRETITIRREENIIVVTETSQLEMLKALIRENGDGSVITAFYLV